MRHAITTRSRLRRGGARALACALWLLLALPAVAVERVLIVADPSSRAHRELTQALEDTLAAQEVQGLDHEVVSAEALPERLGEGPPSLLVTIGTHAALASLDVGPPPGLPILHALIPARAYARIRQRRQAERDSRPSSAIFLDQPLRRRLRLLALALPGRTRVGVLLGPSSALSERELQEVRPPDGLRLEVARTEGGEDVLAVLRELLDRSDVLLSVADPKVYNRNTIRGILLTTYRHRVPVMGFSRNYVKAGALLAVYSTPRQLGRQLGEALAALVARGDWRLPESAYPAYFEVSVNRQVARSLDLPMESGKALRDRLLRSPD